MMAIILSTSLLIFYNKGTEKSQSLDLNEISNDSPLRVQTGSKYVTDKSLWGNLIINKVGISGNYQNTNDMKTDEVVDDQSKLDNLLAELDNANEEECESCAI